MKKDVLVYFLGLVFVCCTARAQEPGDLKLWLGNHACELPAFGDTLTCAELQNMRNPTVWVGSEVDIDYSYVVERFTYVAVNGEGLISAMPCVGQPQMIWEEEMPEVQYYDEYGNLVSGPQWRKPTGMFSNLSPNAISNLLSCPKKVYIEDVVARRHLDKMEFNCLPAGFTIVD